jgi:predicted DNA-binding transcriptional regulator AlpA
MTTTASVLDLTNLPPTLDLVDAARLLGIGRTLAYEMVRDGTWPTPIIRARRKIRVPTAPLCRLLHIDL